MITITLPDEFLPMNKITITKPPFTYSRVTNKAFVLKLELHTITDGIVQLDYKISFRRDGEQETYQLSVKNQFFFIFVDFEIFF